MKLRAHHLIVPMIAILVTVLASCSSAGEEDTGIPLKHWKWTGTGISLNAVAPCQIEIEFAGPMARKVTILGPSGFSETHDCLTPGPITIALPGSGMYTITPQFGATPCAPPVNAPTFHTTRQYDPDPALPNRDRLKFVGPTPDNTTHITIVMSGVEEFENPDTTG